MKPSPLHHAFTLIELLVVCSILGILVVIAIPIASQSRAKTNLVKCTSNMRQIGTALLLYAAENNGYLPVTSHTTGNTRIRVDGEVINTIESSWIYSLAQYFNNINEIRVCPADEPERRERILQIQATSYILNDILFDYEEFNRLTAIPHPAHTMMMFISNRPVSKTWDHAHCGNWNIWQAMAIDAAVDRHRVGKRDANFLKGSSNYLFADGHVENISAQEMKRRMDAGQTPWRPDAATR